jgi:DtxR family Mn-dependent transcriptional regulator
MPTSTVENYIKQIYAEETAGQKPVPMGKLALAMGVVPGTATSMVKALADSGLVKYEARAGVQLTPGGEQLALHVLRRHRLVELFLVKTLGLDWSSVHAEADALEHAVSDHVLERIDALLGHPRTDPHGDAIPTAKGKIHEPARLSLADAPLAAPQKIARILDQSPPFLQYIDRQHLTPGTLVTLTAKDPAAETLHLRLKKSPATPLTLSLPAATKILVDPA